MENQNDKAKQVADELSNFINNFNCDEEGFVENFFQDHPTLVQKKLGLLFKIIEKAASGDIRKQTRNEASLEVCELMVEGYKKEYIKHLVSSDDYWTQEKAEEFVNSDNFSSSNLPRI